MLILKLTAKTCHVNSINFISTMYGNVKKMLLCVVGHAVATVYYFVLVMSSTALIFNCQTLCLPAKNYNFL